MEAGLEAEAMRVTTYSSWYTEAPGSTPTVDTVTLTPYNESRKAELLLRWNGTEWEMRCGCRLHPEDRNKTHGRGPHIHTEECREGHTG